MISESDDSDLPDYTIRNEAKKSFEKAAAQMVQQQLALNPPSLYDVGDNVIVQMPLEEKKGSSKNRS